MRLIVFHEYSTGILLILEWLTENNENFLPFLSTNIRGDLNTGVMYVSNVIA